jgi:hypothetical protein
MTNRKSPNVTTVMGKVRKTRMGRRIVLTIPKIKAATRATINPSTRIILGKRYEIIRMATILMMRRTMKNIIPPLRMDSIPV